MRYSSSHEAAWPHHPYINLGTHHSMNNNFDTTNTSPEKVFAERINGWAAMLGFWAVVGAYLTTGQIVPGLV